MTREKFLRSSFIQEVYRWGFLLAVLLGGGIFLVGGTKTSLSFLAGTALSLLFFWTLERTLRWLVERQRRRWKTVALFLAKDVVAGAALYGMVRSDNVNVGALGMGLCVVYFGVVMALIVPRRA